MIKGIPPQISTSFLMVSSSKLMSRSFNSSDDSVSLKGCNSIISMGKLTLKSLISVDVRTRQISLVFPISEMKFKKSSFVFFPRILGQYSTPCGSDSRSRFFSKCNKSSMFSMINTTFLALRDLIRCKVSRIVLSTGTSPRASIIVTPKSSTQVTPRGFT